MLENSYPGIVNKLVGPAKNETERAARTVSAALGWALALGLVFAICWQPKYWAAACIWAAACNLVGMLLGFLFGIPRILASGAAASTDVSRDQSQDAQGATRQVPSPSQDVHGNGGQQVAQVQAARDPEGEPRDQSQGIPSSESNPPAQRQTVQGQPPTQAGVNTNLEEISDWLTKIIVGVSLVELQKAQIKLQDSAAFIAQTLGGLSQISFAYGLMVYFSVSGFLGSYLLTRLYLQKAFRDAASGK